MPNQYPDALQMTGDVTQMFENDAGDQVAMIGRALRPGVVNSVELIPSWTLAGATTNSRTYTLRNRTQAGVAVATLALVAGVTLTKGVSKAIPITAANATLLVGDVLEWESLHVGSGLPDPGGIVIVQQSLGS